MSNKCVSRGLFGCLVGAFVLSLATCSDQARDCDFVCNRWKDCVNASYDASSCRASCEGKASKDRDFDDRLDHCASCAQGRSCSETGANCLAACVGVVP